MAASRQSGMLLRPMNVEQLAREAEAFEFFPTRSLKSWLRSAQLLVIEAANSEQDGDIQRAYLFLMRHATLVLGCLPKHPDYQDPKVKDDIKQANAAVKRSLPKLEQWRPQINKQYDRYVAAVQRRNAELDRVQQERLSDEQQRRANDDDGRRASIGSNDGMFDNDEQSLNANDYRQLAVDLAHREIRRRDATKQSTQRAGIPPAVVAARRQGIVLDEQDHRDPRQPFAGDVGDGVREAGRYLHDPNYRASAQQRQRPDNASASSYRYPAVPAKERAMKWDMQPVPSATHPGPPPMLPAKQAFELDAGVSAVPPRPQEMQPSSPQLRQPSLHNDKSKYTFRSTASTEGGAPLRPVYLPPELRTNFLNRADSNTARNLETCGILCGSLISNALFINHLIIPDQNSTSDTCDTTEEGDNELFDFCDSHDLLVCGWIHTHPSQSCFLSSRDLHTSSGYQIMLPEAIAIVCAPRHNPDWGIFRLTDPPGLPHVLKCEKKGLFHPHDETNLYTDAVKPGHVVEGPGLQFKVVDLRKR